MTKPIDIVSRALKDIGALEAGEVPTADAAQDAFDMFNDMLDQWSNESMMVFYKTEVIWPVVQGQTQYTIGPNPNAGQNYIGSNFTGYVNNFTLTVTGITSGAVALGQTLANTSITTGTKIVAFETGAGGNVNEAGTYTMNNSIAPLLVNAGSFVVGVTYVITVVGTTNFVAIGAPSNTVGAIFTATGAGTGTGICNTILSINGYYQRPLAINSAFVRIATNSNGYPIINGGLDYPISILDFDSYELIGLKTLNGPWPKALYYQPTESMGNIFVWPNPAQGEMHMFVNTLLSRYVGLYDNIQLPEGYNNALRWCLAERLMPMYGKASQTQISLIIGFAGQSKATIKRTNMRPPSVSRYDEVITTSRSKDAGWILSGGFFR